MRGGGEGVGGRGHIFITYSSFGEGGGSWGRFRVKW